MDHHANHHANAGKRAYHAPHNATSLPATATHGRRRAQRALVGHREREQTRGADVKVLLAADLGERAP